MLHWSLDSLPRHFVMDSGADDSFIDTVLAKQINIPLLILSEPYILQDPLHCSHFPPHRHYWTIWYCLTRPSSGIRSSLVEKITTPTIDWSTISITSWSIFCHQNCLMSDVPTTVSISQSPPEEIDFLAVPGAYYDLNQVFSRGKALSLPPHRPYSWASEQFARISLAPAGILVP